MELSPLDTLRGHTRVPQLLLLLALTMVDNGKHFTSVQITEHCEGRLNTFCCLQVHKTAVGHKVSPHPSYASAGKVQRQMSDKGHGSTQRLGLLWDGTEQKASWGGLCR